MIALVSFSAFCFIVGMYFHQRQEYRQNIESVITYYRLSVMKGSHGDEFMTRLATTPLKHINTTQCAALYNDIMESHYGTL